MILNAVLDSGGAARKARSAASWVAPSRVALGAGGARKVRVSRMNSSIGPCAERVYVVGILCGGVSGGCGGAGGLTATW